jgi:hypothetical protein
MQRVYRKFNPQGCKPEVEGSSSRHRNRVQTKLKHLGYVCICPVYSLAHLAVYHTDVGRTLSLALKYILGVKRLNTKPYYLRSVTSLST